MSSNILTQSEIQTPRSVSPSPANTASPCKELILEQHQGVWVVRDDLYPGGTKARFCARFFDGADEVVYASPCEGGAQFALAMVGQILRKRVTIFCAKRKSPHPRSVQAKALGAQVLQVSPGYLSVVQARSRSYCEATGARLLPFGLDTVEATETITKTFSKVDLIALGIREVWCAAGSGMLARGLLASMPSHLRLQPVAVGRELDQVGPVRPVRAPWRFEQVCPVLPPFPSDPHYDAKAWAIMPKGEGRLFWNVAGPARMDQR
jgi:hypothetical protein